MNSFLEENCSKIELNELKYDFKLISYIIEILTL